MQHGRARSLAQRLRTCAAAREFCLFDAEPYPPSAPFLLLLEPAGRVTAAAAEIA